MLSGGNFRWGSHMKRKGKQPKMNRTIGPIICLENSHWAIPFDKTVISSYLLCYSSVCFHKFVKPLCLQRAPVQVGLILYVSVLKYFTSMYKVQEESHGPTFKEQWSIFKFLLTFYAAVGSRSQSPSWAALVTSTDIRPEQRRHKEGD